jgi:hypothetical protein
MKRATPSNGTKKQAVMQVLVDNDVLLAYVMNRGDEIAAIDTMFKVAVQGHVELYVTSYAIAQLNLLLELTHPRSARITSLLASIAKERILPITRKIVSQAEDSAVNSPGVALTVEVARHANMDAVIVLDTQAFAQAHVSVWQVSELLVRLNLEQSIYPTPSYEDLSAYVDGELSGKQAKFINDLSYYDPSIEESLVNLERLQRTFQDLRCRSTTTNTDIDTVLNGVMNKLDRMHMRFNATVAGVMVLVMVTSFGGIVRMRRAFEPELVDNKPIEVNEPPVDVEDPDRLEQDVTHGEIEIVAKTKLDKDLKGIPLDKSALGAVLLAAPEFPSDDGALDDIKDAERAVEPVEPDGVDRASDGASDDIKDIPLNEARPVSSDSGLSAASSASIDDDDAPSSQTWPNNLDSALRSSSSSEDSSSEDNSGDPENATEVTDGVNPD